MRKFRVWDIREKKMYYTGFYVRPDGSIVWRNDAVPEPDSYVLMQSAFDDIEIWEGDIRQNIKEKYIEEIYWDEFFSGLRVRGKDGRQYDIDITEEDDYKIIGNKWESPALFEK